MSYLVTLAVLLASASQALAQPPIIILPGLLDSQLIVTYNKSADSSAACNNNFNNTVMWVPSIGNATEIGNFLTTFAAGPGKQLPDCWFHVMQLQRNAARKIFTSNIGVTVRPALSISQSYVLKPLQRLLLAKSGLNYSASRIKVLAYDWRLDINSMTRGGQLAQLRGRIQTISRQFKNESVILVGYSQGNLVARALLRDTKMQALVKGYIAIAPPFGGSARVMGALSSGALEGNIMPDLEAKLQIPPPYNQIISREYLMYNAAQELASLAMQAPSPAGFPGDPVVAVAGPKSYKVSQLGQLFSDIGQPMLAEALKSQVDASDFVPIPGVPTYCIYGGAQPTPTQLTYKAAFAADKINELPVTAGFVDGDSVVPLSSLSLCDKLTDKDNVYKLMGKINHFTVLNETAGLAAIAKAFGKILEKK